MNPDRRQLLRLLAAGPLLAAAGPLLGAPSAALPAADGLYLAARKRGARYEAACIDAGGADHRVFPLPGRGHSFAIDPARRRAVVFGRQPGFFAYGFGLDDDAPPRSLALPEGRHFFGHGSLSADGQLLFTTENDYETGRGVVGVYDADKLHRLGEFDSTGIGPHELLLMPDGHTLCVANGGILTHPDYGKTVLNRDTMAPSLAYIDSRNGRLLESVALAPALHQLSIRHLALDRNGAVWFGCQHSGPAADRPALVGRHRRGEQPELLAMPDPIRHRMRNYVGSVAASGAGDIIATTSPLGGLVVYWDADSGRCLGSQAIADGCGAAPLAGNDFLLSDGFGGLARGGPGAAMATILPPGPALAWDNHLRRI